MTRLPCLALAALLSTLAPAALLAQTEGTQTDGTQTDGTQTGTAPADGTAETPMPATDAPAAETPAAEAPAAAPEPAPGDTVVVTVNGTPITAADLRIAAGALPPQYQALPPDQLLEGLVEQLIRQQAVVDADGEETPEIAAQLAAFRRNLLSQAAVEAHLADAVSDAEVQAAYEEATAGFAPAPEFRASHILVETEDEAKALVAELEGGADFAELARTRSTGPSGPRGGDLGWFGEGQMVPEFETAVKALEPGAVSAPVQTQFGWHVIKLDETRESSPPALEEVRPAIEENLRAAKVNDYVEGVLAGADVQRTPAEALDPAAILAR